MIVGACVGGDGGFVGCKDGGVGGDVGVAEWGVWRGPVGEGSAEMVGEVRNE